MKKIEQILGVVMLLFAIGFNLWLYRLEPTATTDPNDNTFQFALVDRTNQVWDFAAKKCSENIITFPICFPSYLVDHWVPNWAEGYNLPFYYSHIPQILIVGSYRIFSHFLLLTSHFSLFQYYHWIIYLLMCLFPLSMFLALRVIGLSWLTSGMGTLLAMQISTDGLYGLDPSSFLWRGYGLSSQLFAMIFLPLAIAYSWRWLAENPKPEARNSKETKNPNTQNSKPFIFRILNLDIISDFGFRISDFTLAVFFLFLTTAGHLGIGIMAILSLVPLAFSESILLLVEQQKDEVIKLLKTNSVKLIFLAVVTTFFLSYWVIPILLGDNYHNISFWDPVWKFNSYGAKETITRLLNGDLFDFGRFPVYTLLVLMGVFGLLIGKVTKLRNLSFLFLFWLFFYFGRTTWGGLIDLVPGMKEFHLSRFIVGLHVAGMFLAPFGFEWLVSSAIYYVSRLKKLAALGFSSLSILVSLSLSLLFLIPIYRQTIKYNELNDKLIKQANENYAKVKSDSEELIRTLKNLPPARTFVGRGGQWGKNFKVAETQYFMHLSTYGIPVVLWLPETWSPNSDTEQYFSEDQAKDYSLYNIGYVGAPPDQAAQKFWNLIKQTSTWKLYSVKTDGYITTGVRPAIVATDKRSYINVVRQWIQSDQTHVKHLYPELTFNKDYPKKVGLPNFKMTDEVTYQVPDGSLHNIFQEPPVYLPTGITSIEQFNKTTADQYDKTKVISQEENGDMIFKATVTVDKDCTQCLVILKQSFHPNWHVTIDGKPAQTLTVFPFFVGSVISEQGTHEVVFSYEPSQLKVLLLIIEFFSLILLIILSFRFRVSSA